MADTAPKKKSRAKPAQKFVTEEKFNELQESIKALTGFVKDNISGAAAKLAAIPETPLEKEVTKAKPDFIQQVNPEWVEAAKEIIGEALDHCEVKSLRSGGTLFTVVIKKEFSNAPDNYMAEYKEDRRTKELGAEGIGGVENWCKLIKQNLARAKPSTYSQN